METTTTTIPVVDLQDFPAESGRLVQACQEWGCFRIINFQGILQASLLQEMKAVVTTLLDLPTEIKVRNHDVIPGSGYMAPSPTNPLYEALGVYDMACMEDVEAFCSNLEATPHQRATMLNYAKAIHGLMIEIGQKIGQGLGMNENQISCGEHWSCQFRINKYTFDPVSVGSPGVQLHTDSSFLTILQDDENLGGLEVLTRSGNFVAVDPWPGALIINLGDIATVWSNGRFLNVKHRVMCKEPGIRISIASFLLGPKEGTIEAPDEVIDREHPRVFVPFTYQEFRKMQVSNKHAAGEALDGFFCLCSVKVCGEMEEDDCTKGKETTE